MDIAPAKVPGSTLLAERDTYGVTRQQIADRLQLHRNTVRQWELDAQVDVIRQRRYRQALAEIVSEAIGGRTA